MCTPACKEGHKWDFPQVKTIAGQGKLYVSLQKPKALIGMEKTSTLSDLPSTCTLSVPESVPDVSLCDPQPSTSTGRVSSNTIKVGPSSVSNKGTGSQSTAVNISTCNQSLGVEALEGWFSFRKSKCADNITLEALVMVQHT